MDIHHVHVGNMNGRIVCKSPWNESYKWMLVSQCGSWDLNSGLLEEQQVFLTIEQSLLLQFLIINI